MRTAAWMRIWRASGGQSQDVRQFLYHSQARQGAIAQLGLAVSFVCSAATFSLNTPLHGGTMHISSRESSPAPGITVHESPAARIRRRQPVHLHAQHHRPACRSVPCPADFRKKFYCPLHRLQPGRQSDTTASRQIQCH